MSIAKSFLPELDAEINATRSVLDRVPEDQLSWQPHPQSMTLGRLASHVAELPRWAAVTLEQDEFDMAPPGGDAGQGANLDSVAAIKELFEETAANARESIAATSDEEFMRSWTLKSGGEALFSAPKVGVLRRFVFNHLVHHRGQLTVYLRLVGAPVPQTFGPTADEPDFAA